MLAPITIVLRSYRGMRRWSARHKLPPWLADLFNLATNSVRSAYAYLVTFFYTICYARHFYSRLRPLVTGSTALRRATPCPYLLRPFPYFLAFLGLMIVLQPARRTVVALEIMGG